MNKTTNTTRANVRKLSSEAAEAGDLDMVAICERALDGDAAAWSECERVLADAAARRDD